MSQHCYIHIYRQRMSKGAAAPPLIGRKYDPASHVLAERENVEKVSDETRDVRSMRATRGREEERTILIKKLMT